MKKNDEVEIVNFGYNLPYPKQDTPPPVETQKPALIEECVD